MPESIIVLMMSMLKRRDITIESTMPGTNGLYTGICNKIEAEDGSGTSFNVMIGNRTFYLKRPQGTGTAKDPIRMNRNVETVIELYSNAICGD